MPEQPTNGKSTLFDYRTDERGVLIKVTEPRLTGEITADIFKIEVNRLLKETNVPVVVVDLSNVRQISSVMIGTFVGLHNKLTAAGGELRQCCLPPVVESVYRTANLIDSVFSIYKTPEHALGPE